LDLEIPAHPDPGGAADTTRPCGASHRHAHADELTDRAAAAFPADAMPAEPGAGVASDSAGHPAPHPTPCRTHPVGETPASPCPEHDDWTSVAACCLEERERTAAVHGDATRLVEPPGPAEPRTGAEPGGA